MFSGHVSDGSNVCIQRLEHTPTSFPMNFFYKCLVCIAFLYFQRPKTAGLTTNRIKLLPCRVTK